MHIDAETLNLVSCFRNYKKKFNQLQKGSIKTDSMFIKSKTAVVTDLR